MLKFFFKLIKLQFFFLITPIFLLKDRYLIYIVDFIENTFDYMQNMYRAKSQLSVPNFEQVKRQEPS